MMIIPIFSRGTLESRFSLFPSFRWLRWYHMLRKKSNGSCCLSPRGRRSCCYYTMSLSTLVRSSDYLAKVAHKEDEEVVFICMLDCVSIGRDSRSFWSSSSLVNSSKKRRVVGTIWREVSCVSEKWRSKKKKERGKKSPSSSKPCWSTHYYIQVLKLLDSFSKERRGF